MSLKFELELCVNRSQQKTIPITYHEHYVINQEQNVQTSRMPLKTLHPACTGKGYPLLLWAWAPGARRWHLALQAAPQTGNIANQAVAVVHPPKIDIECAIRVLT
jgi:hypothetical protein